MNDKSCSGLLDRRSTKSTLTLSVGMGGSPGDTQISFRVVDRNSGVAMPGSIVYHIGATPNDAPPELHGMALATVSMPVLSRAQGSQPARARLDTIATSLDSNGQTSSPSELYMSRTAAVGYSRGYAAAAIVDGIERGGVMVAFNVVSPDRSFSFTPDGAVPLFAEEGAIVSVGGGKFDHLGVAWIGGQACPDCLSNREVFLTRVDRTTGTRLGHVHASAGSSAPKLFPHIAFDGLSFVLVWREHDGAAVSRVMFRRFDTQLGPLGPAVDLGRGTPWALTGDIDLVVEDVNSYGVVMTPQGRPHHFVRITCTGPK